MKKLYVGNLPFQATEEQVTTLFSQTGVTAANVTLVRDRISGQPRGFGFVEVNSVDEAERAQLDKFIRKYVATSNEKVATTAVDKAVKENKVQAPEVIQSRIAGPFTGYTGRTIFTLENGQRWAQSQRDSAYFPKIDSPPVLIMKSGFGYRMYIAGGGAIRVSKVQ